MTEEIIKQKLDTLADFYSQKDALELHKRELLDDVKVPAEIEQIVKSGMKAAQDAEAEIRKSMSALNSRIDEEAAVIKIPAEVKAQLDALDAQRAEVMATVKEIEAQRQVILSKKRENETLLQSAIKTAVSDIQMQIEQQTRDVYATITQRKNDIEIEFRGKAEDVEANIKKLEAEIKADVKATGASVKGKFFHAVYVKGRVTWNTDKMDAWVIDHPFLKEARKEGEPSITLRKA